MSAIDPSDFQGFAARYLEAFAGAVRAFDVALLEGLAELFLDARRRGAEILVAGNGGSAAIANHFECDATKGTHVQDGAPALRSRSLSANMSVLTALGNDLGYASVFERQVEYYGRPGDLLVLGSSSGSSPNVVAACRHAKAKGLTTLALVGFKGGVLKAEADHVFHVPVENYGIVEDCHQAVIHLLTQYLRRLEEAGQGGSGRG